MPKYYKRRSKKMGLPPGSLVHIGQPKSGRASVSLMDYDEKHFQEKTIDNVDECIPFKDKPSVTWINVDGVHEVDMLDRLGRAYGLHPLVLEDIANTDQRPKMDDLGDYIYLVAKMIYAKEKDDGLVTEQVSLVLGANYVLSFQEGIEGDVFNPIRERIRTDKGQIRKRGTDYLVYSLLDAVVDSYFAILERMGEKIESLEAELVSHPTPRTLHALQDLKKEMVFLRKSVWPLREVISGLERAQSPLIRPSTFVYLRDVYDHSIQVIDTLETFRDMLSGMLDIYLSSMSNRINSVMKVLTIIATIFMPLTFIAGVYGMNFKHMPELEWRRGYPLVMGLMALVGLSMLGYFKHKRWF
ncbi:MAG: magnesium/cobalt transporter CorA [Planctomycetes bacterium]|nr:magnesium/cobalt transporter CorA [Planctomycetota bacterium]